MNKLTMVVGGVVAASAATGLAALLFWNGPDVAVADDETPSERYSPASPQVEGQEEVFRDNYGCPSKDLHSFTMGGDFAAFYIPKEDCDGPNMLYFFRAVGGYETVSVYPDDLLLAPAFSDYAEACFVQDHGLRDAIQVEKKEAVEGFECQDLETWSCQRYEPTGAIVVSVDVDHASIITPYQGAHCDLLSVD